MGRLHDRVLSDIALRLKDLGLTLRDHSVLNAIALTGAPSQQDIATDLGIDRSDLVRVLDRLEESDVIRRRRSDVDRRRHELTLTTEGKALLDKANDAADGATAGRLASLTTAEQGELHHLLLKALGVTSRPCGPHA
ncbi:MarR family winged helix-turn-helix transcriptional regulator [Frondihabitans sp. PAMC 28766]|uniref:MarR family winged helix-turn-helix transcriptional regulator n=1 Tax=Frondihabitans sp. PAMC 28766 TaxID=1795630 RepID=UPI003517706C